MSQVDGPLPLDSPDFTVDGLHVGGPVPGSGASLTIDFIKSPLDDGLASISGTYESPSTVLSIGVVWRDAQGTEVTAGASFAGGAWSLIDVDVSTLHPGEVLALVTLTALSDSAFDAASTIINAGYPHLTGTPWATHANVTRAYPSLGITDTEVDEACWIASDILCRFTGLRWMGISHVDKLRPQATWRQYDRPAWWQTVDPLPQSRWGYCSCNRGKDFGCNALPEIRLPYAPVHEASIVVLLDGNLFQDWVLRDGRWLVRTDQGGWPCCQRTDLDDTEGGTWSVSFSFGEGPDSGGVQAAATLGYELSLAYHGHDESRLPRRLRTLTRQGTTIGLLDPMTLFDEGLTGLTEVDLWTKSVMVGNSRRRASISTVGREAAYRRQ